MATEGVVSAFGFGPRRRFGVGVPGNPGGGGATNTSAQAVSLFTSAGAAANNVIAIPGGTAPIASATLNQQLSTASAITSLPATVGASSIANGSVLLIVWGGYFQAFTTTALANSGATSISISSATPFFAFPSGTVLAVSTALPYLKFPASPPAQNTGTPCIGYILHNHAYQTTVKPWVLHSDGTLYDAQGGGLVLLEPGNRIMSGTTSYGALEQEVSGLPTASQRVAFQALQTTETGGFNIAVNAWMA